MSSLTNKPNIGLTGSIGSGCSTLSKSLTNLGFTTFTLSDIIKLEWENRNKGKQAEIHAKKSELQDIGNEFRQKHGNDYLALEIIKRVEKETDPSQSLVFDSIRNTAEIEALRKKYNDLILIAVDCPVQERWRRMRHKYQVLSLTKEDFERDNLRDKNEAEIPNGQQVELCVNEADIFICNELEYDEAIIINKLEKKIKPYIDLVSGKLRHPVPKEHYMSIAYTASLMSKCYKRQVGAVIVDEKNDMVLSIGYNENPSSLKPCLEEYTKCYRDIQREKYFKKLNREGIKCPSCKKLVESVPIIYRCKNCGYDLEDLFLPDRAISQCRALHAEQKAIMSLGGKNAEGATIYVTTFPCAKCANDIIQAKIIRIVYVSAYPDPLSAKALVKANVTTKKFEGVTACAYFKLFGSWRKETEDRFLSGET